MFILKKLNFYVLLITNVKINLMKIVKKESNIFFKEHPFNNHYKGNMAERDWIFPELDARGSFFSYWKKGIKTYLNK